MTPPRCEHADCVHACAALEAEKRAKADAERQRREDLQKLEAAKAQIEALGEISSALREAERHGRERLVEELRERMGAYSANVIVWREELDALKEPKS